MTLSEKHLAVIEAGNTGRILLERLRAAGVRAEALVVCDSGPVCAGAAVLRRDACCARENYLGAAEIVA
jgi:hypothetical protein